MDQASCRWGAGRVPTKKHLAALVTRQLLAVSVVGQWLGTSADVCPAHRTRHRQTDLMFRHRSPDLEQIRPPRRVLVIGTCRAGRLPGIADL